VAQRSVLGPHLFIFYTANLADEVKQHQVNMHTYADDTQLYLHCCLNDTAAAVTRLEICLDDVSHWMAANRLKLKAEKTELIWAGSRCSAEAQLGSSRLSVRFGTEVISASDHVRVLGVTISSDLSLGKHVANVCSSGFYWLHQLRRVRRSLDTDSIKTLVHAFAVSRVDYCNAVFAGSPRYITDKLQCVLNAAACLVTGTRKFDHGLSHLLHGELHWLDVPGCIQ